MVSFTLRTTTATIPVAADASQNIESILAENNISSMSVQYMVDGVAKGGADTIEAMGIKEGSTVIVAPHSKAGC